MGRGRTSTAGRGTCRATIEAYWALRLVGDPVEAEHMRSAARFIREAGRPAARARVHARVAGAVRAVAVGAHPGAAAGDRAAALLGAAERLRLRLLGASDDRGAVGRDRRAGPGTTLPFDLGSCTAPSRGRRVRLARARVAGSRGLDRMLHAYERRPIWLRCGGWRSRAPSAGSCAARRPMAPGAGSSRRGCTR